MKIENILNRSFLALILAIMTSSFAQGKYLIPALSDMHVHLEGQAWSIMYPPGSEYQEAEIDKRMDQIKVSYAKLKTKKNNPQ